MWRWLRSAHRRPDLAPQLDLLRAAAQPPSAAASDDDEPAVRPSDEVAALTVHRDLLLEQRAAVQAELNRRLRFSRFIP